MLNNLTARGKVILSLVLFIVVLMVASAGYFVWQKHADTEARLQQATVLSQDQARDNNVLQNQLKMSNQNAQMMADFIKNAQVGQVQPVTNFTVMAPSPQQAAQQVADRINKNDPTLPPAALEKTDQTVVSSVKTTPEQKAAIDKQNAKDGTNINDEYLTQVYKNNNYRNWEWSGGYGQHGDDRYIPVELQRNFSKDAAVSYEHHFAGKQSGWEVKYTRKTDKLFFLF